MKLLNVDTLEEARRKVIRAMEGSPLRVEEIELLKAQGYVLAEDVCARENVPLFRRSTVDGYAVRAADTVGAGESIPAFLRIVGEVEMGCAPEMEVTPGTCVYVPTGGMIPEGADGVVMMEFCELFSDTEAAVYKPVAAGANIVEAGDDMKQGQKVLKKGTKITPQAIGALAALGITRVRTYCPWKITVISTGDELVAPRETPKPGQVRDINTYGIYATARQMGFEVAECAMLKDDRMLLLETAQKGMEQSDIVVISGGSSQGKKDETNSVIDELASEGAFTHGLALKPGKPTILGYDRPTQTLLAGLPGHPAAAMLVFRLVIGWLWRTATGEKEPYVRTAEISTNLPAAPGKLTCQLVHLARRDEGSLAAIPIFGRSGLISTLSGADGYILIEENKEGLKKGERVSVYEI